MSTTLLTSPAPTVSRPGALARVVRRAAGASARRPRRAISLWLVLIAGCIAAGALTGTRNLSDAGADVGPSAHALARLHAAGLEPPAVEDILVSSASASTTRVVASELAARAGALRSVAAVRNPIGTPSLSRNGGRTELVVVSLRGDPDNAENTVAALETVVARLSAAHPGVRLQESGDGSGNRAIDALVARGLHHAELISVPLTLIILLLAFGALVAACVPLLFGITAVAGTLGALGVVSQLVPNGSSTAPVVVLIGLAVGVDYSLFYIRRVRDERSRGAGPDVALDAAAATVGRAVVVAGVTVVIGLAGLLFTGFGLFTSMALGAILVVAFAVLGSLSVLPAVLSLLGDRIDRGRMRPRRRRRSPLRPSTRATRAAWGAWERLASVVTGHPQVSLALAACVLVGLAAPIVGMRTSAPSGTDVPASTPVMVAQRAIDRDFPGASDTGELVVTGERLGADRSALARLGSLGERSGHGRGAVTVRISRNGETAVVAFPVVGAPVTGLSGQVAHLRQVLAHAARRLIPGARAQLTGDDAESVDFTHRLTVMTPLVIAFVLVLAFGLLVGAFGSALLALSVMLLNLLSVGAAFGVLVTVFEHRWAQSLLDFTSDGAITNWIPLFSFVVLFGLSMDYTVLVLERAAEARRAGATPREAAARALSATGAVVTSAAAVMVAVFSVFATLPLLEMKELGVGLGVAIALDATVVRGVALPAALALLGERGLPGGRRRRKAESDRLAGWAAGWDHETRVAVAEGSHE